MAVQYQVDFVSRIVRATFTGVVAHRDPTDYAIKLRRDPAFDPTFSELVSFGAWSEIHLSFWDFGVDSDPFSKSSKHAIIAEGNHTVFGIARMCQTAREGRNIRIFATRDEAEAWLVTKP